jgi:hypothetical protein
MPTDPRKAKVLSGPRIIATILGLAALIFLLVWLFLYFPDVATIIGRLLGTLAMAVVIVTLHRRLAPPDRRGDKSSAISAPTTRAATIQRILVVWLVLFVFNTLFFAI